MLNAPANTMVTWHKESLMLDRCAQSVLGKMKDGGLDDFSNLENRRAEIDFVMDLRCTKEMMTKMDIIMDFRNKYAKKANQFRMEGNANFKKKFDVNALKCYSKAIIHAPLPEDEANDLSGEEFPNELALAYANRSAVLFHLKKYDFCVRDIELSMKYGYPEESQMKLLDRKGKCFLILERRRQAVDAFQAAIFSVEQNTKMDDKAKAKWLDDIFKQIKKAQSLPDKAGEDLKIPSALPKPPVIDYEAGKNDPSSASIINENHKAKRGRHLVTSDNIPIGKVLMKENPLLSVLYPKHYGDHCYHCMAQVHIPIPCFKCTAIVFCSTECRERCMKFHKYECYFLSCLDEPWCGQFGHLNIQTIIRLGMDRCRKLFDTIGKGESLPDDLEETDDTFLRDYYRFIKLQTHHDKKSRGIRFDHVILSIFLTKILECANFFGDGSNVLNPIPPGTPEPTKEEIEAEEKKPVNVKPWQKEYAELATLLYYQYEVIQCNAMKISEYADPTRFDNPCPVDFAIGLYPSQALLNHSCYPNATREYYGDISVIRTITNIKEGEEITIDYGPTFISTEGAKRRKLLKDRYYFFCRCEACEKDWPEWRDMEASIPMFKCLKCGSMLKMTNIIENKFAECSNKKCLEKQCFGLAMMDLQKTHDQFGPAIQDAYCGEHEKALPNLIAHYNKMQETLCHPWRELAASQSAIAQCYKMRANVKTMFSW